MLDGIIGNSGDHIIRVNNLLDRIAVRNDMIIFKVGIAYIEADDTEDAGGLVFVRCRIILRSDSNITACCRHGSIIHSFQLEAECTLLAPVVEVLRNFQSHGNRLILHDQLAAVRQYMDSVSINTGLFVITNAQPDLSAVQIVTAGGAFLFQVVVMTRLNRTPITPVLDQNLTLRICCAGRQTLIVSAIVQDKLHTIELDVVVQSIDLDKRGRVDSTLTIAADGTMGFLINTVSEAAEKLNRVLQLNGSILTVNNIDPVGNGNRCAVRNGKFKRMLIIIQLVADTFCRICLYAGD